MFFGILYMTFVCSYRWCDRPTQNEVETLLSSVGQLVSWRRYNAACSKIKYQVKLLCICACVLYQGDVNYSRGNCATWLHPSAPVAPSLICSDRPVFSLVCHARHTSAHRSLVRLHWFKRLSENSSNWRPWRSAASVTLLAQLLVLLSPSFHRAADVLSRRHLRSSSTNALIVRLAAMSFRRRQCVSGCSCQCFQ